MPRAAYNVSRQRSRGNAITINGLLTWRAKRLRGIRLDHDNEAEHLADIAAIDRVLVNVLGFTGAIDALTRDYRREALFRRNELRRMVCDVLPKGAGAQWRQRSSQLLMRRIRIKTSTSEHFLLR